MEIGSAIISRVIYLDHNATTPVLPEVFETMVPYFRNEWGNPSSTYRFGSKLKSVIEAARMQVAELIGARPSEIVFTSGATEANNAAINAALRANPSKRHIVTSAAEHSSVLAYCHALEKDGYRVSYLGVNRDGLLSLKELESAISKDTALVSLMWANNETGVLFPVAEVAHLCREHGVLFHCDSVQAIGKVSVDVRELPADYLSIAGHKLGAPKGVGALFVRRKAPFRPFIYGGHQESGRRGGTESVGFAVALGAACAIAARRLSDYDRRVRPLRDFLEEGILGAVPGTGLNGHKTLRIGNTSNISFDGLESEALLMLLDERKVCASAGSACLADSQETSHVIAAKGTLSARPGWGARRALSFVRNFLGFDTDSSRSCAK